MLAAKPRRSRLLQGVRDPLGLKALGAQQGMPSGVTVPGGMVETERMGWEARCG